MIDLGRKAIVAALAASTLLVAGCATETTYRPATGQGFQPHRLQRSADRA